MIVCTNCGHENDDDAQFCEVCQEYLEWKDERAAKQRDAKAAPEQVAALSGSAGGVAASARAPEPEPRTAAQPTPIRPGPEYEPPGTPKAPPPPEPQPGELICDRCGTGNRAEANFCRRCGNDLTGAAVMQRLPWWRRIFSGRKRTHSAGERRRRGSAIQPRTTAQTVRHSLRRTAPLVGVLAVLGLASFGAWRGDLVDKVGDAYGWVRMTLFPRYEAVIPNDFRSSSRIPGHGPKQAFDKVRTTFWAEGAPGNGRGEGLEARFHRLVDIARVGFWVGDQAKPQNFVNRPTPRRVRLRFFDPEGQRVARKVVVLAQTPDFQRFSVEANGVTRVELTILTVYRSQKGHEAAISEVEFFRKH
jgi:ribosomal protein L40E